MHSGKLIVLTAPLTEAIDHAGFFIQMAVASLPHWLQPIIDQKYPVWRKVERNDDGSSVAMPAGVRLVEASLLREYAPEDVVCCYPDDLPRFIGERTRVVAVSTHNPLGVTFAAGVYASLFGSSREPINSHHAKLLFQVLKDSPYRPNFKVIVGGSGGWQIANTNSFEELSVDCVVEGRSESSETLELFRKAINGDPLPRTVEVKHPRTRDGILVPKNRTTFGVVEMTTGCGRRCQFCAPDLNPQLDLPKSQILAAVEANARQGNRQVSLATEDMFIWGQVNTGSPFYFPNREALLDLYRSGDPYTGFGKAIGSIDPDAAGGGGVIRDQLKVLCLGVQYCMQAFTLASRMGVSDIEAHELLQFHRGQSGGVSRTTGSPHQRQRCFWLLRRVRLVPDQAWTPPGGNQTIDN